MLGLESKGATNNCALPVIPGQEATRMDSGRSRRESETTAIREQKGAT